MQPYIYGPVYYRLSMQLEQTPLKPFDALEEQVRFKEAVLQTKQWYQTLAIGVDEEQTQFHETLLFYQAILDDEEVLSAISKKIDKKHLRAEEAIRDVFLDYSKKLLQADAYFQHRVYDLHDVQTQIIFYLREAQMSSNEHRQPQSKPYILLMERLTISDFAWLDFNDMLAVVAEQGGYNSHAAIILRSNDIPLFIIPEVIRHVQNGDPILIDTTLQTVQFKPSQRVLSKIKPFEKAVPKRAPHSLKSPIVLSPHQSIHLYPAFSNSKELESPIIKNSEGIGLVRTEFFALEKGDFLSELEQYQLYFEIASKLAPKMVYFRLYDIEPDKATLVTPTSGYGIHFYKQHENLVRSQMKALLRVSLKYPIAITIPMIENPQDVLPIKVLLQSCMKELEPEQVESIFQYQLGVMLETLPIIHQLEKLRDIQFIQIGSNDLLSRLLEIPRDSSGFQVDLFYEPLFLRTIRRIVTFGNQKGVPLFLCGEAANHPAVVTIMIAIGIQRFVPSLSKTIETYHGLDAKRIDLIANMLPQICSYESIRQVQKKLRFL